MKTSLRTLCFCLMLGGGLLPSAQAGMEILLYPFARAFGSPPEKQLADCREAFQRLQAQLSTGTLEIQPVFFVASGQRGWRRDLAQHLAGEVGPRTSAHLRIAEGRPAVPPPQFRRNQLRYAWERAAEYAAAQKAAPPAEGFSLYTEIWGQEGKVYAIHVYVFDARGQLAYLRFFNSHQFGPNLPQQSERPIQLLVQRLFADLLKDPEKIFPRYGVG